MYSEKLNPEAVHVLLTTRNSSFGGSLIQDLNSKQKILPTYDREVPSSNSLYVQSGHSKWQGRESAPGIYVLL